MRDPTERIELAGEGGAEQQVPKTLPASVLAAAAHSSLPQVATALGLTFVVLAPLPALRVGLQASAPVVILSTLSALLMIVLHAAAKRDAIPYAWAHTAIGLSLALMVMRGLGGWYLFGSAPEAGWLAIVIMLVGIVCLHRGWFVFLLSSAMVGWLIATWAGEISPLHPYMVIFLLAAPVVATVTRRVRIDALRHSEVSRIREAHQKADLTAALHRIEQSEANFHGIFDRIQDVLYRTDLDGTIQMVSPSVERYGYCVDELIGARDTALLCDPADREHTIDLLLSHGELRNHEISLRTKSGELVPAAANLRLLVDPSGRQIGIEGMVRDMSQLRKAEEEQRQQRAQLAHVLRLSSMGEMAAEMAHELNQPLSAMSNYAAACARMIRSRTDSEEKLLEGLGLISEQAVRAGEIIHRLKEFVGKRTPQHETVDLAKLIDGVIRMVEPDARQHDSTIRAQTPAKLPPVSADPVQIRQVLVNLLLNGIAALDGTHGENALTISVSCCDAATLEITVKDTGPGLGDNIDRVFEPFFTTKGDGLGMGLTISRSIAEAHGGRLWATQNAGPGTTFHFTLPVHEFASLEAPMRNAVSALPGR